MKMRKTLFITALVTLALVYAGIAQANQVSGSLWHVSEATSQNAIVANVPGTTPDVTFSVNTPFNFSGSGVTVNTWLGSSSAFGIVQNTPGTLTSLMDNGSQGTLVDFKGFVTVTNGQTFTVTHDDGLTLIINGLTVVNAPGPTAAVTTLGTYSGASGTFAFELVYGECCGGPAVLQVDLPFASAVPEPATMLLLGFGLAGLAGMRKLRK
jgi:hypothetical protein